MSACGACGGDYRVGTLALVFSPGEPPSRKRVCPKCAGKGLLIVAKTAATKIVKKEVRSDAVERVLRMLKTYASAAKSSGLDERAEGLECALETLRRETGGET
jgi:hypothetical protein